MTVNWDAFKRQVEERNVSPFSLVTILEGGVYYGVRVVRVGAAVVLERDPPEFPPVTLIGCTCPGPTTVYAECPVHGE